MKRLGRIFLLSLLVVLLLTVTAAAEEAEIMTGEILPFSVHTYEMQDTVLLQGDSEELLEYLHDALLAGETEIDISRFGLKYDQTAGEAAELLAALAWIKESSPDLFHVVWKYGYTVNHRGVIEMLRPQYNMTGQELQEAQAFYRAELEKILEPVDESWSDLEKALYFNGYLASHYQYDMSLYTADDNVIYDAYGFLKTGEGVCQAYYYTCKALLDACGIPSTYGKSGNANHIWNVVQVDGKWYHLDVTWNDPTVDDLGAARHTYALVSTDALHARDRETASRVTNPQDYDRTDVVYGLAVSCTDLSYDNAPWKDINAPYVEIGGKWYYSSSDGICVTSDVKKSGEVVIPHGIWNLIGNPYAYWPGAYSGLGTYKNWLIYNSSDQIKGYNPVTGEIKVFYTTQTDDKDIYGIKVDGNQVTYWLDTSPNCTLNCRTAEYDTILLTELDGGQSKKYGGVTVSEKDGLVTVVGTPKAQEPFYILAAGYTGGQKQKSLKLISSADLPEGGLQWQMEGASVKLFLLSKKYAPLD